MKAETITKNFDRMGARVLVREADHLSVDISHDQHGPFFDIRTDRPVDAIDVQPKDRHLLLIARAPGDVEKFLCGHDERSWFVAGVNRSATTVQKAKDSLRPAVVSQAMDRSGVKGKKRDKRRNTASKRQGEWFFIETDFKPGKLDIILKDEPIQMGRSRPHRCEFLCRFGGEDVWVNHNNPNGISERDYQKLPVQQRTGFRKARRNANVYAKGRITASDHNPLVLSTWHIVVSNTERRSANVAFLD